MTQLLSPSHPTVPPGPGATDGPRTYRSIPLSTVFEMAGSAIASLALVWFVFAILGISGLLGLAFCGVATFFSIYGLLCWRLHGLLIMKDRLATVAIWAGSLVAFIPLVGVIGYVAYKGGSVVLARFPHFIYADFSGYTANAPVTAVGAGAAIVGTIEQVGLATVITVPLGVLTATYLVNSRNVFATVVSNVVDAMTGSPAIIAGLFIYLIWVVPQHQAGKSGFSAALALSVMMLPIVTRASQEVIAIVPGSLREAALALGSTQWRAVLRVILPTARVGLVTGVILGIARIAGETAPVLFVAGGDPKYNWNPFSGQQDDLPLRIYQMIFQPGIAATRDAWGVSFVLVLVVLTLFLLARLIGSKTPGPSRFSLSWRRPPLPEVDE